MPSGILHEYNVLHEYDVLSRFQICDTHLSAHLSGPMVAWYRRTLNNVMCFIDTVQSVCRKYEHLAIKFDILPHRQKHQLDTTYDCGAEVDLLMDIIIRTFQLMGCVKHINLPVNDSSSNIRLFEYDNKLVVVYMRTRRVDKVHIVEVNCFGDGCKDHGIAMMEIIQSMDDKHGRLDISDTDVAQHATVWAHGKTNESVQIKFNKKGEMVDAPSMLPAANVQTQFRIAGMPNAMIAANAIHDALSHVAWNRLTDAFENADELRVSRVVVPQPFMSQMSVCTGDELLQDLFAMTY
jgi:hypothetical protein